MTAGSRRNDARSATRILFLIQSSCPNDLITKRRAFYGRPYTLSSFFQNIASAGLLAFLLLILSPLFTLLLDKDMRVNNSSRHHDRQTEIWTPQISVAQGRPGPARRIEQDKGVRAAEVKARQLLSRDCPADGPESHRGRINPRQSCPPGVGGADRARGL